MAQSALDTIGKQAKIEDGDNRHKGIVKGLLLVLKDGTSNITLINSPPFLKGG